MSLTVTVRDTATGATAQHVLPPLVVGLVPVSKLLIVMEENHSAAQMEAGMPYLVSLGDLYGKATGYTAAAHPSLPNYLAIAGGSTFGVTDDNPPASHPILSASIFGQAVAAGKTSGSYCEGMPSNCALTASGEYAAKHNPQAYFVNERPACATTNRSTSTFLADAAAGELPNVAMLIPNLQADAHDGTLAQADAYLKANMPAVLASTDFTSGKLVVVIVADEDSGGTPNGVLAVVLHASLQGVTVNTPLSHYSLSRLASAIVGAAPLLNAASAPDMAAAFGFSIV